MSDHKIVVLGFLGALILTSILFMHLIGEVRLGGWAFRGILNLPCTW